MSQGWNSLSKTSRRRSRRRRRALVSTKYEATLARSAKSCSSCDGKLLFLARKCDNSEPLGRKAEDLSFQIAFDGKRLPKLTPAPRNGTTSPLFNRSEISP